MARMAFKAGDEYALKLSRLDSGSEKIAKKAIYESAEILADGIRAAADKKLSDEATGQMMESYGISEIDMDKHGYWNTKIGFDGYDDKGVPNQLKARVFESGSSKQKKRPFIRPTVNRLKGQAQKRMEQVVDEEIKKVMK
jgi:HK97 gp10 family phage protein